LRDPGPDPVRFLGWLALLVALVLQAVGLYSASAPGPEVGVPGMDKVGHLVAFAVPAALAWLLGARWVVVALVLHALLSEPLQAWVAPLREPDPLDAVADLVGIALGVTVARALRRRSAIMGG
jgi:VanZ family protein